MATIADRRDAAATLRRLVHAVERGELTAPTTLLVGLQGAAIGLDPPTGEHEPIPPGDRV